MALPRMPLSAFAEGGIVCYRRDRMNTFEKIYAQVRRIPRGKVATYGQIALLAGNPHWSQVVGYAIHSTPAP